MISKLKIIIVLGFLVFGFENSYSQKSVFLNENQVWTQVILQRRISADYSTVVDFGTRYKDWISNYIQFFFRAEIQKKVGSFTKFGLGYAHFYSDADVYPNKENQFENRIYQSFTTKTNHFGLNWSHRFRLEERYFTGNKATNELKIRPRYMIKHQLKISQRKNYLITADFSDEFMMIFGQNTPANHIDQNRIYIGISVLKDATHAFTIGFQNTMSLGGNAQTTKLLHTIRVAYQFNS